VFSEKVRNMESRFLLQYAGEGGSLIHEGDVQSTVTKRGESALRYHIFPSRRDTQDDHLPL